jgi:hypothetical protein
MLRLIGIAGSSAFSLPVLLVAQAEKAAKPRAQMERKHLVVAQKEFLPIAQPCSRCGLPGKRLKWFRYQSPRSTWVNLMWSSRMEDALQDLSSGN